MKSKIILLLVGVLLIANYFSYSFLFYLENNEYKVVFFDVGQGDAVFIKTPENYHILIDGGPGSVLLDKLKQEMPFFYNEIDLVILSHAHYDHVSGFIEIIDIYDVKDIICTGAYSDQNISQEWREIIKEKGYKQARAGQRVVGKDFYIDTLYPAEDFSNKKVDDLNVASVISRVVLDNNYSFLFTGDVYAEQEEELVSYQIPITSDVLKVSHHGSETATSEVFLTAVSPSVGVIMAGRYNDYGHPHEDVLQKLEENGIEIRRTDQDGDVIFKIKK
jgi:competence protein ComEC